MCPPRLVVKRPCSFHGIHATSEALKGDRRSTTAHGHCCERHHSSSERFARTTPQLILEVSSCTMLQQRLTVKLPNHGGYESARLAHSLKQMRRTHPYCATTMGISFVSDRRTKRPMPPRATTTTTVLSANFIPKSCDGKVGQHGDILTGANARNISSAQLSAV